MADCSNRQPCPCTYPGCPNHGKCCECIAHHREKGAPACMFSKEAEKTYDRSIEALFKDRGFLTNK